MEHYLLLISAIGSCIAALTGLLILRSRYGLPRIQAHVLPRIQVGTREDDPDRSKDTDQEVHRREVCFKQPDDPSVWLVCDVSISRNRYKWLSKLGDPVRNDFGEFIGYYRNGNWTNRIKYDPPVSNMSFLLHTDAPDYLWLSFRTILMAHPRIKRRVRVLVTPFVHPAGLLEGNRPILERFRSKWEILVS